MKCFQIVKAVLDEAYGEIPGSDEEKDAAIEAALGEMQARYRALTRGPGPDYASPVVRFGYVYKYVTCHANLVHQSFVWSEALQGLLDLDDVTVTCLGGGPGSDLLGVLKFLEHSSRHPTVTFNICDREQFWMDSWADVGKQVGTDFRIFSNYVTHDACKPESWGTRKYLKADLFTLVYFMSEVYSSRGESSAYFEHVFSSAKSGALLLFIDNNDSRFCEWFDGLAISAGMEFLEKKSFTAKMPREEQTIDLGEYSGKKFGHHAKLDADVAVRIVRKIA